MQRAVRKWIDQLERWVDRIDRRLDKILGPPAAVQPPRPALSSGLKAPCAVCGVEHELEAVCHRCGAPLCDDTRHCRLTRYAPQIGRAAVYCPACYPKL